jgi:hypothetical protein
MGEGPQAAGSLEPASRRDADEWLRARAEKTIQAHLRTREDADFARSVKSMIDQTAHEYGGRFLFELIQNGYDEQPRDSDTGRIALVLAHDENEHGVLYAANTGCGFTRSNVRAIANLGLSDKTIGEGIGNKGVGFKSVLQICGAPEIYSVLPDRSPGFCFRFATPSDVPGLVGGNPTHTQQVLDELSLYSVTVPAETTPQRVRHLWAAGYSTVIRLPLHSDAKGLVVERLEALAAPDAPVMLFLNRLRQMTIRHERDADVTETALTRARKPTPELAGDFDCDLVTLDGADDYLVLSRRVEPDAVTDAVRDAVDNHRLDPRWEESTSSVEVSIAVPYAAADAKLGRCYTYLPLGAKAPSPFAGHLNAPFFPNLARTDIDASHPLNRLLLTAAAGLSLDAAEAMTRWRDDAAAATVLDVVSWDSDHLPLLVEVAERSGVSLSERPLLPTRMPGRWTSMKDVSRWPTADAAVLTADRAHIACDVEFLLDLDPARAQRLEAMMTGLDLNADPAPDQLAAWTEIMLAAMLLERRPISDWDRAYADIADMFARHADALRSRRILLTDDWELQPCAATRVVDVSTTRSATPFFPPARQRVDEEDDFDPDAELDLPKSLSRRLYYLHGGLTWYDKGQQTGARTFLQENRLVRRFDTRSIFEHIRGVMSDSKGRGVASDALRLVFNLTRGGASPNIDLKELGLRVPTVDGTWRSAAECLFSTGWPDTAGDDLTLIAETPKHRSAELDALSERLLASPATVLRVSDDTVAWVPFLRRIGVTDVLPLQSAGDDRSLYGRSLTRATLASVPGVPELVRDLWTEVLPTRSGAVYPETPYRSTSLAYWLPGQADWAQLTDKVRHAVARQLLAGLKQWPDEALDTGWERDRIGDKDRRLVATPLRAFLTAADWLPVQQPGTAGEEFVRPARCWTFPLRGDEVPPRFAPLMSKRLRDLLDDDPRAFRRLRQLGLGLWGSVDDAPRLVRYLGDLVADGAVADVQVAQFRSMYRAAWAGCVSRPSAEPFPPDTRSHLVVEVGGQAKAVPIEREGGDMAAVDVIVASTDDEPSLLRLLADFRRPLITVDTSPAEVTATLRRRLGDQVMRATDIAPVVLVDGNEFEPSGSGGTRSIVDTLPWMPLLVATLLEFRRGSFTHIGQRAFDDALDALQRIRIVRASTVEVRIGVDTRPLPSRLQGVLPAPHPQHPTLIIEAPDDQLTWEKIDAIAEPLLYLIGRQDFATEFRLAATRMRAADVPVDGPDDTDVADACDVAVEDVRTTSRRIEAAVAPLLARLYPIVAYYAGTENAAPFEPDTSSITGEADTLHELVKVADHLPHAPDHLLADAVRASSLDALRRTLRIPLGELNATLRALGGHGLIDYADQHAEDFADHVRRNHARILDRIRWARWYRFASYDPQPDWPRLRRPAVLTPDPDWGTTIDSLSSAQMETRVEHELTLLLDGPPPTQGPPLRSVDHVSKTNTDLVTASATNLTAIVRAWLARRDEPVETTWADGDSTSRAILDALDIVGALDFAELTVDTVLGWLHTLGLWPSDMPRTDDLAVLGLTVDDLDEQQSEEARRRAAAARARRTVHIDGQPFDLDRGLGELSAALDASLDATPGFLKARNRFTALRDVSDRPGRGGGPGGGGGGGRPARLTDDQRDAVGFAGEWLAYKWLEKLHGADFNPACWVSAYRANAFPGAGDDGLGWDFQVPTRQGELLYEVKTSLGEGGQVELGETQVLAAQQHARNGRWRLIVVTDVLNRNRRLRMLRNPFDSDARGRYVFVGQGLRLRYVFD